MPGIAEVMTVLFVSVSIMLNIAFIIDRAREPKMGTLRIEETEIGSIRYSFDIERPLDDIPKHRCIRLDVRVKGDI